MDFTAGRTCRNGSWPPDPPFPAGSPSRGTGCFFIPKGGPSLAPGSGLTWPPPGSVLAWGEAVFGPLTTLQTNQIEQPYSLQALRAEKKKESFFSGSILPFLFSPPCFLTRKGPSGKRPLSQKEFSKIGLLQPGPQRNPGFRGQVPCEHFGLPLQDHPFGLDLRFHWHPSPMMYAPFPLFFPPSLHRVKGKEGM